MNQQYNDFKKNDTFILITSVNNLPNARSVHAIELNGKFYFLTSNTTIKAEEVLQNSNVVLFHSFMNENNFKEQRLIANVKEVSDISIEEYKNEYLKKYPYMENAIDYIFSPIDSKIIFEIIPNQLRITTGKSDETINL